MSNNDNRLDSALVRSLHLQIADEMTAHRQRREVRREPPLSRGDEEQFAMSLMQAAVSRHMQTFAVPRSGTARSLLRRAACRSDRRGHVSGRGYRGAAPEQ